MQKLFPVLFVVICGLFLLWAEMGASGLEPLAAVQHPLALDWQDTLELNASGPSCTEWGGTQEVIKVYLDFYQAQQNGLDYKQSNLAPRVAVWLRDTLPCPQGGPERRLTLVGYKLLTLAEEAAIVRYMQELLPHSLESGPPASGIPFSDGNRYYIRLYGRTTKKLEFLVRDSKYEWNDFGPLRHRLFPKQVVLDAGS
ncbi:hypothetical protein LGH70_09280 [Hymenobacter sp. BT635]|uniref:Uncharacterized protein n=1 Tax=Hymenobacter nitidus TaxID=2880929 RepID=A0ABS8ADI2_9BACT|nr:hypothetical protein [Hymenobacter nitidus]MCB2377772.1 hypothetical protein [Hymenobacter nitidus]